MVPLLVALLVACVLGVVVILARGRRRAVRSEGRAAPVQAAQIDAAPVEEASRWLDDLDARATEELRALLLALRRNDPMNQGASGAAACLRACAALTGRADPPMAFGIALSPGLIGAHGPSLADRVRARVAEWRTLLTPPERARLWDQLGPAAARDLGIAEPRRSVVRRVELAYPATLDRVDEDGADAPIVDAAALGHWDGVRCLDPVDPFDPVFQGLPVHEIDVTLAVLDGRLRAVVRLGLHREPSEAELRRMRAGLGVELWELGRLQSFQRHGSLVQRARHARPSAARFWPPRRRQGTGAPTRMPSEPRLRARGPPPETPVSAAALYPPQTGLLPSTRHRGPLRSSRPGSASMHQCRLTRRAPACCY